ncbi:MAG: GAF domain-containing protein [Anaerolineaceae bacterium]|nr:GAF domain-containing protein [Anaerolineaceae bacterium]
MLGPLLPDYRVWQRDYLLEISRALTQELDLDKLLGRILRISIEVLSGLAGFIALRSESGQWKIRASHGLDPEVLSGIEYQLHNISSNSGDVIEEEIHSIYAQLNEFFNNFDQSQLASVGLPLITRDKLVGVTYIFRNYPNAFSLNDQKLLSNFANQAAIAVQNAQLYRQINREKLRMTALLDSAADGILILANDLTIERCNGAFARLLDIPSEKIQLKSHDEIIKWASPPQGLTLEKAVAGGWPLTAHAHLYIEGDLICTQNRPALPVGITYAPLVGDDGILTNIITTIRDITRFRQAEELKSTFISVVSHELKTPVALIKGYVSTLRREDASWDREVVDDALSVIEDESDRLAEMIENLLDASRLQAGGLRINPEDVFLPDLVRRTVERQQTQTTKHQISMEFPDEYPLVYVDEKRISQVLSNLVSNAIKYSPGGQIIVRSRALQDQVIICVSDEGPGIAPDDLPHIFDRFYRAPDMAKMTKGAGLGLFLSKSIIESHNGKMWADPEAGKGAKICFSLPRSTELPA